MNEEYIVKSNGLTKKYGSQTALDHVNISIKRGHIYGLVGNNGAGKTTFLKILTGLIYQDGGSFTMMGENTNTGYMKVRNATGVIIENPGFYPALTAKQNLEYFRIQRGIPDKGITKEMLKNVGLVNAANKKFSALSLGMKQRLALALALMGEPDFLILDEPINGLDPSGIIEVRNLILKLNREKNITVLISSHILSELENMATDYGFLNKGKLLEELTAEELKAKCHTYLEVKVSNAPEYVALLEQKLGWTNYKVMPENVIHIMGEISDITVFSELAVKNGIGLMGIEMKDINLEKYYMNLINEKNGGIN